MNYIDLAKEYSAEGFSVIPVTSDKTPALKDWSCFQKRPMTPEECEMHFNNCWGIALLCGGKKKVTGFDADMKYDLSGDLFERFKRRLSKELLNKMYVQTTKNKGFHFLFSCDKIEPNQKLASRYTTADEKHITYMENFNNPKKRDLALKIALNDKMRVLFETRGGDENNSGGYVVIAPTPGYKFIYGSLHKITEDEYDIIMETAREFNEVVEVKKDIRLEKYKEWATSPFEDFNQRFDVVNYLIQNGWEEIRTLGTKNVRLKRAGSPKSKSSALFDRESRIFNCFSTSTSFDVNRGYTASDIFIELECDGDTSVAFKKMVEMGFGQ
jgi:hypothetical protein